MQGAVARVDHAVPNLEHHPAALGVDHVPLVREVLHLAVGPLGHGRADPVADGLAATEGAVEVLDVGGILGEEVGPVVPVPRLARLQGAFLIEVEGFLDLASAESSHGRLSS